MLHTDYLIFFKEKKDLSLEMVGFVRLRRNIKVTWLVNKSWNGIQVKGL